MREYAVMTDKKMIRPLTREEALMYLDKRVHVFESVSDYDDIKKPIDLREIKCWDLAVDIDVKDEEENAELKRIVETLNAVEIIKTLYDVEPIIHFSGYKGYHVIVRCFTKENVKGGKKIREVLAEAMTTNIGLGSNLALMNTARLLALMNERKWYSGKAVLRTKYMKDVQRHGYDVNVGLVHHLDKSVLIDEHRLLRVEGSIHPKTLQRVKRVEKKELIKKLLHLTRDVSLFL